ncbi:helix-turn-helix transcriptional regulator [Rhodopirellula sp. MGV]|uniref:helix-turn-helix transcriptional regulator n=1 Tax=Rhodopirellula sp. MGV TaxID=2023130 RepID=UPI000B9629C6|nr:WYL domain-containing transcriptional regulator [Rhodopirellula sp. MGV]OYP34145.1 WYL domain-containing protein [Rhodopirellula sp. MGV]PNY33581.1 WYL domain-containing transcriptional regulator [Rhodopirellula baltica]
MARNEQLIRQHKLLQLLELSRFGRTLDELRGDLVADLGLTKLHERTVRRDIEALQAAGFDIQSETVQRGRVFKLGQNTTDVHEIGISSTELIALSIGRELLYPLMGTQYWRGIETFWNKVQEAVPNGVFDHYARYRAALHVFGSPYKTYERQEGMLKTINRAILEHRLVEIDYQSIGKPISTRKIEPYGLAVYQSSIYIVAATPKADDTRNLEKNERLRNWKLDRFHQARLLDEYFKADPEIDLAKYLGSSIGIFSGDSPTKVQIKLGKRSAAYVREDPWHPEQTLEEIDEETTMLTVPASHPREILPRVLSLGADAEIIGPDEFRATIADSVRQMATTYGHSNP